MYTVLVISIIIVIVVLVLSLITTSKAYDYKHTVDPLENNPNLQEINKGIPNEEEKKNEQ